MEGGNFGGEEGEDSFVAELSSSECYEERNITHTDFICCIDISSGSLVVEVGGQISEPAEVRTEVSGPGMRLSPYNAVFAHASNLLLCFRIWTAPHT